jgi:predicted O-methyltransferase YrrM
MSGSEALWSAVDQYITDTLVPSDPALDAAAGASTAAGLPPIAVTPAQGKLLHILARLQGARRILEIGTLGGYSTIWLARALPQDGQLITIECEPKFADVARANISRAGLDRAVEIRLGRALDVLPRIVSEGGAPFDLTFIDADKKSIPEYFRLALELSRVGSLIVVDNVVRDGRVIDSRSHDPDIQGIRIFYQLLARDPRVCATAIQTAGVKGYDGFAIALVTA